MKENQMHVEQLLESGLSIKNLRQEERREERERKGRRGRRSSKFSNFYMKVWIVSSKIILKQLLV